MNLIDCRGLNCHLACVVNVVDALGVKYQNAFATLWSETDFRYEAEYQVYVSQRVFSNLGKMGIKTEQLSCAAPKDSEESLAMIPSEEWFIVGMDTFHIPWSHVYQNFYGPHYFFTQKRDARALFCFDPIYDKKYVQIGYNDILSHAFDLIRVQKIAESRLLPAVRQEASEVLRTHPEWRKELLIEIRACAGEGPMYIIPLIKRIDALINNRYLFQRYLHQTSEISGRSQQFFDKGFLSRWEAVKNGLYKAAILKDNKSVVDEVCDLCLNLICEEILMAEEMIGT